jgi:hypothetical protein
VIQMTTEEWIAWAGVVLPLIAKVFLDLSAQAEQRKHNALSRIAGMASRGAADVARTLQQLPPGTDKAAVEQRLLSTLTSTLQTEMAASAKTVGADPVRIGNIVTGEFNKIAVTNTPAPVVTAPVAAPPSAGTAPWTDAASSPPASSPPLASQPDLPVASSPIPTAPAPSQSIT